MGRPQISSVGENLVMYFLTSKYDIHLKKFHSYLNFEKWLLNVTWGGVLGQKLLRVTRGVPTPKIQKILVT